MPDPQPPFDQVNLVAANLDATLDFYRRLGVPCPTSRWSGRPLGRHHVNVSLPGNQLRD